ncbi:MAG: alpha-amylase [Prevotellaceae bacterium]|jgi:glycosidase|nr:alpha-amylase [Prevotellaceae bacterium]
MKKITFFILCYALCAACGNGTPNGTDNQRPPDRPFYDAAFTNVPAPSDVVMYEANERVFAATASLNAIARRLDDLKALGVNVLWLMPINEQGTLNAIGSPYCVKDYTKVEPEYGTLDDLRKLVKQAHSRDMAVIIDWVANHTAWDNEWIQNKSWYTQDAQGRIVSPEGTGWNDVADLDYAHPEMREAMIEAMKYWIYEANIDGFRCDAADMIPADFWKQAIDELRQFEGRTLLMLAEGARTDHYTAGFDMDYGWDFYDKIKKVYNGQAAIANLYASHENEYAHIPAGKEKLRFITNHDESAWDATPIALFGGEQGSLSAFVLTVALGGSPLLYSTQETGVATTVPFFTPTAINWNMNPELLAEYKKIMAVYSASEALRRGRLQTFDADDVACFYRLYETHGALVAVNVRNRAVSFSVPAQFVGQSFTNAFDNTAAALPATVTMEPYQYTIWIK